MDLVIDLFMQVKEYLIMKNFAGAICLIMGLMALINGLLMVLKGLKSRWWSLVVGTITSSKVESRASFASERNEMVSQAEIVYEYFINDVKHLSNRVVIGGKVRMTPEAIVEKYPLGSKVDVYYNLKSPEQSVLEPGVGFVGFIFIFFGSIFSSMGLWLIFLVRS